MYTEVKLSGLKKAGDSFDESEKKLMKAYTEIEEVLQSLRSLEGSGMTEFRNSLKKRQQSIETSKRQVKTMNAVLSRIALLYESNEEKIMNQESNIVIGRILPVSAIGQLFRLEGLEID